MRSCQLIICPEATVISCRGRRRRAGRWLCMRRRPAATRCCRKPSVRTSARVRRWPQTCTAVPRWWKWRSGCTVRASGQRRSSRSRRPAPPGPPVARSGRPMPPLPARLRPASKPARQMPPLQPPCRLRTLLHPIRLLSRWPRLPAPPLPPSQQRQHLPTMGRQRRTLAMQDTMRLTRSQPTRHIHIPNTDLKLGCQ